MENGSQNALAILLLVGLFKLPLSTSNLLYPFPCCFRLLFFCCWRLLLLQDWCRASAQFLGCCGRCWPPLVGHNQWASAVAIAPNDRCLFLEHHRCPLLRRAAINAAASDGAIATGISLFGMHLPVREMQGEANEFAALHRHLLDNLEITLKKMISNVDNLAELCRHPTIDSETQRV